MGQSPSLGLEWTKNSGSSSLVYGDVLWHPVLESGLINNQDPPRANLSSAVTPASGSRCGVGALQAAPSAGTSVIEEDRGRPL